MPIARPALRTSALLLAGVGLALLSPAVGGSGTPGAPLAGDDPQVFAELVQPVLEAKCAGCHGGKRPKLGLSLEDYAGLAKGSRGGSVLAAQAHGPNLLAEVLRVPLEDDLHMPPEGEPQLTQGELDLLGWWIAQGAPEHGSLTTLGAPPRVLAAAQELLVEPEPAPSRAYPTDFASIDYVQHVRPVLEASCFPCHGEREQKGDMRFDQLDPDFVGGPDAEGWHAALDQINTGAMPPRRAPQLSDDDRRLLVTWMTEGVERAAQAHQAERKPVLRRLTRAQYTYALQDLLGIGVDFGQTLPQDGKSKMGFTNNGEVLQASPLHIDTYQEIARAALDQAIAVGERPPVSHYRVTFGKGLGQGKVAGRTGGYQSVPLSTDDFTVEVLGPNGEPQEPQSDGERKALEAIQKRISVGLRGSSQERFRTVPEGLLLYAALPRKEQVPAAWQGPSPNVKLELQRVFPERGDFAFRVRASRGYLIPSRAPILVALEEEPARAAYDAEAGQPVAPAGAQVIAAASADQRQNLREQDGALVAEDFPADSSARLQLQVPREGFYQVDLVHPPIAPDGMPSVRLSYGNLTLDSRPLLSEDQLRQPRAVTNLGAAYLRRGRQHLKVGGKFFTGISHLVVTPLPAEHPLVQRLEQETDAREAELAKRVPSIRPYVGTRTDDGMDYATFDAPQEVHAPLGQAQTYTFHGRLENLPIPMPESGDREILSGFLLVGLWNDNLVKSGNDPGPPLLVEQMEFEAPFLPAWPPPSHTAIFFDSPNRDDEVRYTREVLGRFLERAFRRPVEAGELGRYMDFWDAVRGEYATYEEGVREVLVAALCTPNFLYLVEPEDARAADGALADQVLANRLAFFLWNSPPDQELLDLAAAGRLRDQLATQADRLLDDPRAERFVRTFATEWLRLDRHQGMTVNANTYPALTRFVKRDMELETLHFVHHAFSQDLPLDVFVESDFAMLNQNLAEYYGIPGVVGAHFRPVPIQPDQGRGGLLSQGAFLTGHSDGNQAHPIKRAVWLKEKILGDPPPPPPPNVPDLDPETPGFEELTLKEQLEEHRNNPSCMDCHAGIDPYGVVFERYDAGGKLQDKRKGRPIDTSSELPDGTQVDGVAALKAYLLSTKRDQVATSVAEHLLGYALGRTLSFADEAEVQAIVDHARTHDYRLRSVIHAVVTSPSFTHP